MGTKDVQERLVEGLKTWQKLEDATVASADALIPEMKNQLIRLVLEIIKRDSQTHRQVQEFIIDSLSRTAVTLSTDDLGSLWDQIERHSEMERQAVSHATKSLTALKGKKMLVQEYLLQYLLEDERKHNAMLDRLAAIQKGMYPYA